MEFTCDRYIAGRGDRISFRVDARNGTEAKRVADSLAYAVAWHRGVYPNEHHRTPEPDSWALASTDKKGQKY